MVYNPIAREFGSSRVGEFRQAFCLRTGNSCAIVPLPLPTGRGVLFVMKSKRESESCWRSSTVEQLICNQQVAGSIPIASSNGERDMEAGVAEWLKAADCKSAGILPTVVRIHPPAPLIASQSESRGSNSVVESRPSKPLVAGSIPVSRSRNESGVSPRSSVVEHVLGKDGVTSSSLVVGSMSTTIENRARSLPREPDKPENREGGSNGQGEV